MNEDPKAIERRILELALADLRRAEKMLPVIDEALSIIFDKPQTTVPSSLAEHPVLGHCFLCLLPIYGTLWKTRFGNAHPGCVKSADDGDMVEYD